MLYEHTVLEIGQEIEITLTSANGSKTKTTALVTSPLQDDVYLGKPVKSFKARRFIKSRGDFAKSATTFYDWEISN